MARGRLLATPVLALSVLGWSVGVAAQGDTKTASGTVSAIAADSVTVKVGTTEMKFNVDAKTTVIATGAGTAERKAQAAGAAGPKLSEVIKVGGAVEVTYHDMGATKHAASIRSVASAGAGGGSVSADASGTVKSVSATSLVVTGGGKDWTFTIDKDSKVVGPGAGTAAAAAGGKAAITDLVGVGDSVTVTYHEMGAMMHAANVRVTAKKK
jgi:hypothetical protein